VYEGEVTELTPAEAENPLSGYGKTISHVIVGLKTVKGTKQLRLDPTIYEAILKEKIVVGDVIYIEANTGAVKVATLHFIPYSFLPCNNSVSVVAMLTRPPTTLRARLTCLCQRATCTSAKSWCRMSLSAILIKRTRGHRVVRTSCPSWAVSYALSGLRSLKNFGER
jgi:hypothetical protein